MPTPPGPPSRLAFIDGLFLYVLGAAGMAVALFLQVISVAKGGYRGPLLAALAFTALADAALAYVLRRGPLALGVLAALTMLPTLFIVADFLRRAPAVFG